MVYRKEETPVKKILVIAPYNYLPWFSGGQKFIGLFLQHLGEEADLTVISVASNDHNLVVNYKLLPWLKPGFSRYFDRSLIGKISELVKKEQYTAVVWEHPYMWWLASLIRKKTGVPAYIHTHNIEYQRFKTMGKLWWPVLKFYEKKAFREADGLFFITPEDKAFAVNEWKVDPKKCRDLPYGIETENEPADRQKSRELIAARHGLDARDHLFSFNGLLSYKPNLEAVRHIVEDIDPLLEKAGMAYTILICGKDLPEEMVNAIGKRSHIIYAGFTDQIDQYGKASDILLNPVMSGGGIKTKMVEAIGLGTTVVSTKSGATGMDPAICGNKLKIVADNDWQSFSDLVIREANNKETTPASYYDHYNWKKIVKKIAEQL